MKRQKVKIRNKLGLHARPASMIVDTATKHDGDLKLHMGEMVADAKSILSIMMLAAEFGTELEISAEGCADEEKALKDLVTLFENKFDED